MPTQLACCNFINLKLRPASWTLPVPAMSMQESDGVWFIRKFPHWYFAGVQSCKRGKMVNAIPSKHVAKRKNWLCRVVAIAVLKEFQAIFGKEIDRYLAKLATRGRKPAGRIFASLHGYFMMLLYGMKSYVTNARRPRWTATFARAEAACPPNGRILVSKSYTTVGGSRVVLFGGHMEIASINTYWQGPQSEQRMAAPAPGNYFLFGICEDSILKRLAMNATKWGLDQDVMHSGVFAFQTLRHSNTS